MTNYLNLEALDMVQKIKVYAQAVMTSFITPIQDFLAYSWANLPPGAIASALIAIITTYIFNKHTQIFHINWALNERRKKILYMLRDLFSSTTIDSLTGNTPKISLDTSNIKIALEEIRREAEIIFYPELYHNINKSLIYIKDAYDNDYFPVDRADVTLQKIIKYLYNDQDINQFYWDKIYSAENILTLDKMSSFTFHLWNYRIKPFWRGYKKEADLNSMLQIVDLYKKMYDEYKRGETMNMKMEKTPSARWSIGCYHNDIRRLFGKDLASYFYNLEEEINPYGNPISKGSQSSYNEFQKQVCACFRKKAFFRYIVKYRSILHKIFS